MSPGTPGKEEATAWSSQRGFCPDKIVSTVTEVSKVLRLVSCLRSLVSCVDKAEKNEAGKDVRVPTNNTRRAGQASELSGTERFNEREIDLVTKNHTGFTARTGQQNKDQNKQCGVGDTRGSLDSTLHHKGCLGS